MGGHFAVVIAGAAEHQFRHASFHAVGVGGKAFEDFIRQGMFPGVLDLTTREITDDVFDGTGKPGPERMETAGRMGEPLSGNARAISTRFKPIVRMSCTYIEPGTDTLESMLGGIENGIYAVGMLGGNTDLEQFTFSSEYAFEIHDGKIGPLVRDCILPGNLFETLHSIDAFGSDLHLFGGMGGCGKEGQSPLPVSDGGPHLRIRNLLIG